MKANAFENDVLAAFLRENEPGTEILREQLPFLSATSREMTGVGFFLEFALDPDCVVTDPTKECVLSRVVAEIEGLEHGASFAVFIKEGRVAWLEGFTLVGEEWPKGAEFEYKIL